MEPLIPSKGGQMSKSNILLTCIALFAVFTAFAATITNVNAGSGSFPNGLYGNTWFTSVPDSGETFYYGNASTSRSVAPFYMETAGGTANNCGGTFHGIESRTNSGSYVTSITVTNLTGGSTQCPDPPSGGQQATVTGHHRMRLTVGASLQEGVTTEVINIP